MIVTIFLLDNLTSKDFSKLVCARDLAADLKFDAHSFSSDSNEASTHVVQVLPGEFKTRAHASTLYSFRSHNDRAAIFVASLHRQIGLEHLCLCTHY